MSSRNISSNQFGQPEKKPPPPGYEEFTDKVAEASGLNPFEHDSPQWHAFHGYLENAVELDSWKHYADYSAEELLSAATENSEPEY